MITWRPWHWRLLSTLLFCVFLLVPGSSVSPFDGVPLAPYEIAIAFVILVIIWGAPAQSHRWLRKWYVGSLAALIAVQLVGAAAVPRGWSVCLQRELEPETLSTPCEASAQFRGGNRTFVVPHIDYEGHSFPLHFMNEQAFHYTSEDEPERTTMPFSFQATAYFRPAATTELHITSNTPDTVVRIDGEELTVPFDETVTLPLPADTVTHVELAVTAPHAASNTLKVTGSTLPYHRETGPMPGRATVLVYSSASLLLLGMFLVLNAALLFAAFQKLSTRDRHALWYSMLAVAAALLLREQSALAYAAAASVLAAIHVFGGRSRQLIPFILIGLFAVTFNYITSVQPPEMLKFLEGGSDELTHTAMARTVMKTDNVSDVLIGGEQSLFYFQPGYRYIMGAVFSVLGETLWAPALVQTFLLSIALWCAAAAAHVVGGALTAGMLVVLQFFSLVVPEDTPLKLAQTMLQEGIGVPLFVLTIALTARWWWEKRWSPRYLVMLGLLWGFLVSVRTNLLPAAAALALFWLAVAITQTTRRERIIRTASLATVLIFPALVMLRNLIVAGQAAFLPTSLHPNLIDPFRPLFPDIGGASDLTMVQAVSTIIAEYNGRLGELMAILWQNMTIHYVGGELLAAIGWLVFLLAAAAVLTAGSARSRLLALMLSAVTVLPAAFGAFFLHRSIAVHSQTHLVVFFGTALVTGLAVSFVKSHIAEKIENKKTAGRAT